MEYELILRIFVAAILGGLIGLEREYRSKEAGFRTHFLVALGSALFMIVSAYGFSEVQLVEPQRWDLSRIAAQVVSGIGFIGAGTIIFRKNENAVSGLTTAAGLWRWHVQALHRQHPSGARRTGVLQLLPSQVRQVPQVTPPSATACRALSMRQAVLMAAW